MMKQYNIILVLVAAVVLCEQTSGSTPSRTYTGFSTELEVVDAPNFALHRTRRAVDIFSFTRAIINGIITNLQNAANTTTQLVTNIAVQVNSQSKEFLANVNGTLNRLLNDVDTAIQNVVNVGQVVLVSITECANQEQVVAQNLISNTLTNLTKCATGALDDMNLLLNNSISVATVATQEAVNLFSNVSACGIATLQNFLQVGACLNQVLAAAQTSASKLNPQLTSLRMSAIRLVTATPVNLVFCSTTTLASAGLATAGIVGNIGQCAYNVISNFPLGRISGQT